MHVLPNFISRGRLALPDFCALFKIPDSKWLPKQKVRQRSVHVVEAILRARLLLKSYRSTAKSSCFTSEKNFN